VPGSGRQGQIENYAVGAASHAPAAEPWASPWDEGDSARARDGRSLGSWGQNVRPDTHQVSHHSRTATARAFADVYAQNVRRIYGFFGYRVASREEAEDLTQQTFERALRAWARFDPARASAPTWLLSIARNLLIDHSRAAPPRQTTLDGVERPYEEGILERGLGISAELERALASLSDRDRELIALRYGGDLTGPEIAALTGLSLANVQQILSRALRRLRSLLEPAADVAT
jgi:RNA polymerase sigma-70 factor (ECF subfamily)